VNGFPDDVTCMRSQHLKEGAAWVSEAAPFVFFYFAFLAIGDLPKRVLF
jgi:hypothetical protein